MCGLVIIYFALSLFSGFIMKDKKNIIGCGLVGFYPKKNKKVDLSKLYPLWVLNEDRGTHSCGISYGGKREVGINTKSKARDLITDLHQQLIETDLTNMPVICHTRHATNGAHNESNAHPFRWHRGEETQFFTFAHNGVIRDLYNFKKDLGMSRHSESLMTIDSQVLGLAMYDAYTGILTEEEILTKYEGNAAFLCYDKDNVFKAWKGANLGVEERPLYYIETKDGWYFSSMGIGLAMAFLETPKLIPNNTLLTFSNHKLTSSVVYDRKIEAVFTTATSTSSSNFKQLVTVASSNETTTSLKILDNAVKLTLKYILGKKEPEPKKDSENIVIATYGENKAKYCIQQSIKQPPISGIKVVSVNPTTNKLTPKLGTNGGSGRVVNFQNGVVVQTATSYYSLQEWYSTLVYNKNNTIEDIFNKMYDLALKTIVDYIPLYSGGELTMVIYLNNGKLDYITNKDRISTNLPSILGINMKAVPVNDILYINSF